ncbi:MAG: rubrerythrin family protein [Dorea sp.]|nr:rubrerythrin family protein [Dorea sp.]
MAVEFSESKTRENLMRAFAGESQARNRYTIAAGAAKKQGMYAINQIFLFTAEQERAHAKVFYDLLKSLSGTTIHIDGGYPVDHFDDVAKLLRSAQHNEMEEFDDVYPAFRDVAKEEGFAAAAAAFDQIAKIEEIHGKRFGKLAELLEKNQYYESGTKQDWMCLNCGHMVCGKKVPQLCPVCRHEKGYFIPAELAPYLECGFLK